MDCETVFGYFKDWKTKFYIDGKTYGGPHDLTNDQRIHRLNEVCQLKGKRVLELGALEGAHSLMLSELGAREIISIEGRAENFVKCCCIKNLFELRDAHFVLADVRDVKSEGFGTFDIVVAIGILYHLRDPASVLHNLSRMTARLFVWTHYSDKSHPTGPVRTLEFEGKSYSGKLYTERPEEPLSGLEPYSFWPFEQDLYRMIDDTGFSTRVLDKGSLGEHGAKHCTLFAERE